MSNQVVRLFSGLPAALTGLAAAIAGPVVYLLMLSDAWLRRTGAGAFALLGVGTLVGLAALFTSPRRGVRIIGGIPAGLTVLFALGFFLGGAVPAPQSAADSQSAPDFTLPDQAGRPVTLSKRLQSGPVLLVFYRGHW
ncbi:MAG: hypothetical protein V3T70_02130 [Phycisphaerae bacterium]